MAKKDASDKTPKVKKRRWYHQLWEIFTMVRKARPSITWWILLIIVGGTAVGAVLGQLIGFPIYVPVLVFPFTLLGAMFLLSRWAESVAYGRIEGRPGATGSALGTIRRGWNIEEEPIAVDPRSQDLVFRAVGRPGVVLIGEGPPHRLKRLLEAERRKVARVLPNVPIILLQCGREEGQIPLPKIAKKVQRQKPKLTKVEVAEVSKRLRALRSGRLPIPKGVDITKMRPDRKGMRGR
ncbi:MULTISPECIES: DUF4191 domain-containing protein [unclassified Pseudactinotalea]|uniref:DUF4191 domain-containing protein n=1 Tax=Micrococcales TaxID=85006 RepID=UPI003C7E89B1